MTTITMTMIATIAPTEIFFFFFLTTLAASLSPMAMAQRRIVRSLSTADIVAEVDGYCRGGLRMANYPKYGFL